MRDLEGSDLITVFAPAGIKEVEPGDDLALLIVAALASGAPGPLQDGDIVVVTSKVVSKAEGRTARADQRERIVSDESSRTVASRGATRIVRTRHGLTLAAAGVDRSNVDPDHVLLLPLDPDASARSLRSTLQARTGARLGVVVSDTAGRAWRLGQTDMAVGASGVHTIEAYAGRRDRFGNELEVTAVALADEVAAAADLVKAKLAGRPVAVVRGLGALLTEDQHPPSGAGALVRPEHEDLFGHGTREAVLQAVLVATGQPQRYEELVVLDHGAATEAVLERGPTDPGQAALLRRILAAANLRGR